MKHSSLVVSHQGQRDRQGSPVDFRLLYSKHFSLLGQVYRWYGRAVRSNIDQDSDPNGQHPTLEGGLTRMLFILSFSLGITIGAFRVEDAFLHPVFIVMIAVGSSVYAVRSYIHARRQVPAPSPERQREGLTPRETEHPNGLEEPSVGVSEGETPVQRAVDEAHSVVSKEASHDSLDVVPEESTPAGRKVEESVDRSNADDVEIASLEPKTAPQLEVEDLAQVDDTSDACDTSEPRNENAAVSEEPPITTTEALAEEMPQEEGQLPEREEAIAPAVTRDGGPEAGIETDEFRRIELAAPPPTFAVKRSVLERNPFAEDSPVERSSRQIDVPAPDHEAFELTPVVEPKVSVEEGAASQPSTAESLPSSMPAAEEIPVGDNSVPVSQPSAAATGKSKPKQLSLDL